MKARSKYLCDRAVSAALSSIEIYNKPDFKYREEAFVILTINAWELLLKAKLVKDGDNKLQSIYVYDGRYIRRNRKGNPLTITLNEAISRIKPDPAVAENISVLEEIRNSAVHLYNPEPLKYVVYALGTASLRNFKKLAEDWFDVSFSDYNFYILPMGFVHAFKTLRMLEVEKTSDVVANIIKSASEAQQEITPGEGFDFACEIKTNLISAKKFAEDGDLTVKIDQSSAGQVIVPIEKRIVDQYPMTYADLISKIKRKVPSVKQPQINEAIKKNDIKVNSKYSAYNFRTKAHRDEYERSGRVASATPSLYNEEAVRFLLSVLDSKS